MPSLNLWTVFHNHFSEFLLHYPFSVACCGLNWNIHLPCLLQFCNFFFLFAMYIRGPISPVRANMYRRIIAFEEITKYTLWTWKLCFKMAVPTLDHVEYRAMESQQKSHVHIWLKSITSLTSKILSEHVIISMMNISLYR